MLKLRDFFHLPQVDSLLNQMLGDLKGIVVVAGLDQREGMQLGLEGGFLPSGRSTIFGILLDEIMTAHPQARGVVISADKHSLRIPRQLRRRIEIMVTNHPEAYPEIYSAAIHERPDLLVVDRLSPENALATFTAAQQGLPVLTQLDTLFCGSAVVEQLADMGIEQSLLANLSWVLAVHRLPTLCPRCKKPELPDQTHLNKLIEYYPELVNLSSHEFAYRWVGNTGIAQTRDIDPSQADVFSPGDQVNPTGESVSAGSSSFGEIGTFFRAEGCTHCRQTGRQGDIAVFDIYQGWMEEDEKETRQRTSLLPMELYILHLASLGRVSLDDFFNFQTEKLHKTYKLLTASEHAFKETKATLERKVFELEAANLVLKQRTEALISLQTMGQFLIHSTDLENLAQQICRRSREVCGAERAILYYQRTPEEVEAIAQSGWEVKLVHKQFPPQEVFSAQESEEPTPFNYPPPGVPERILKEAAIRAGLSVPLVTQDLRVGLMLVHTSKKARFKQGEVALLQAFANQAALAIQRASLIDELRMKILQLQNAQAELVKKERLEHEMALARQVQQSVLPKIFPQLPGLQFAAHNEPARQVGGDFYDVIDLDENHIGIAIGDVSDKGMPAALYMALTRSLLRAEAKRARSPAAVLANTNRLMMELGEPNQFVTAFYGVLEKDSHVITYARAGHDRPILLRGEITYELEGQGAALGLFGDETLQLEDDRLQLNEGDRLILYTDGLCDIANPQGELFDRHRLKAMLEAAASMPLDAFCDHIFATLHDFRGESEQFDDMTLLVMAVEAAG
jgi:serine phosphatase RsbU (regulator of sigma subunit)